MSDAATIVFGGQSPEHDISILTGLQCERVLTLAGHDVQSLYWDRVGDWHLVPIGAEAKDFLEGPPLGSRKLELTLGAISGFTSRKNFRGSSALELGIVLNCFHGGLGESGGVQALFQMMDIPATGGTPAAAALGMDKLAFAALMQSSGIPTLPRLHLSEATKPNFDPPFIIKPRFGGSSIGIEIVGDLDTALGLQETSPHLRRGAVIEPYRPDLFDLNIAFRTYPMMQTSLLERPIRASSGEIYSYADKYLQGSGLNSAPRELPAQVPKSLTTQTQNLALQVAELTGLTGVVRVDFLSDGLSELLVNEVNTVPGAMALYLWSSVVPAATVLQDMLSEARESQDSTNQGSLSDGSALRAAGGIAGKLLGLDVG